MSILIVSNSKVYGREGEIIDVNEFIERATSEDGISLDTLYVNINDIDELLYEQLEEYNFFTLTGEIPLFIDKSKVEDWTKNKDEPPKEDISFGLEDLNTSIENDEDQKRIANILESITIEEEDIPKEEEKAQKKDAKVILFGSSKGGTGKTFTSLISCYRFAKKNPHLKIAMSDFDIIDGQIGISIHKVTPTVWNYHQHWQAGDDSFETMKKSSLKSEHFPQNIDFYLAPKDLHIDNDDFWFSVFSNLIENYDVVFFDSGIDYLNLAPISTLYKIADKVILVSTTSIKSVSSVVKQINKLKGIHKNDVFTPEDGIGDRIYLVITQIGKNDKMNSTVFKTFENHANIIAKFGVLTSEIQEAEYFSRWDIFDKHKQFNALLDKITELD